MICSVPLLKFASAAPVNCTVEKYICGPILVRAMTYTMHGYQWSLVINVNSTITFCTPLGHVYICGVMHFSLNRAAILWECVACSCICDVIIKPLWSKWHYYTFLYYHHFDAPIWEAHLTVCVVMKNSQHCVGSSRLWAAWKISRYIYCHCNRWSGGHRDRCWFDQWCLREFGEK